MAVYGFKAITTVPTGAALIDTVLYRTQRKTPTVIRKNMKISRIRSFYMLKVKYTQNTIDEKLRAIVDQFPKIDEIHPFYRYWFNVMYDKDHYKISIAQINQTMNLVDRVGKHYIKLLKHADSLYQCKSLKKAALGRMVSLLRKQGKFLAYLEQIRQHMSRLPSIDPTMRSIILTGFPSVGKSSLMNSITDANVEVEPWEFTTRSLFVGHMDYRLLKYQVIDTPGLLDQTLDKRNNIELQAITALAYLNAAIVFVLDPTGGFESIKKQVELYDSLKPFFHNKPVVVALSKTDLWCSNSLTNQEKELIQSISSANLEDALQLYSDSQNADPQEVVREGIQYILSDCLEREAKNQSGPAFIPFCSQDYVLNTEGVTKSIRGTQSEFRNDGIAWIAGLSAELLLKRREAQKMGVARKAELLADGRLHVAIPVARDNLKREPIVPESVKQCIAKEGYVRPYDYEHDGFVSERLLELANGGASVYKPDERKNWLLENDEWKNDVIPYVMDGKNILDFITVDEDIEEKLRQLEEEEERLAAEEKILAEGDEELQARYDAYMGSVHNVKPEILGLNRGREIYGQSLDRKKQMAMKKTASSGLIERKINKLKRVLHETDASLRPPEKKMIGKRAMLERKAAETHPLNKKRTVESEKMFMNSARGNMSVEDMNKTIRDDHKLMNAKDKYAYKLPNYSAPEHLMKGKMHGFERDWR